MIEFVVLTGFLGSGKTTLLRDFLSTPEAAGSAVIVNEVGTIGLDGAILRAGGSGLPIAELASGCICCTLVGELALTVQALLAERPSLRRIVLETSGVSRPGPILRALMPLAPLGLAVRVVATFDCCHAAAFRGFEEAAAQWAGAHTLVLTKRDLVAPDALPGLRALAGRVNPLAELLEDADRAALVGAAFAPGRPAPALPPSLLATAVHPRLGVFLGRQTGPIAWDDMAAWLDNLAGLAGERLLRLKGLIHTPDAPAPVLVQSVGTVFSAPALLRAEHDPFVVVIARDLLMDELASVTPAVALDFAPA